MTDSDEDKNGAKADNLYRLKNLGVAVPDFVVINHTEYDQLHEKAKRLHFPLIIRSSASVEDQKGASFAGVFHSAHVDDPDKINDVFRQLQRHNQESAHRVAKENNSDPNRIQMNYIVQELQQAVRGGVAHIPAKGVNIMNVEVGKTPDQVTDGSINPTKLTLKLDDTSHITEQWQTKLIAIAKILQQHFDGDQEIEWLQNADNELYVVQVRPFAVVADDSSAIVDRERERLQSLYAIHSGSYDTAYVPDILHPTPLTAELMCLLYVKGLISQGIARRNTQPLVIVAGNLYIDKATYRPNVPVISGLQQSKILFDAYRAFKKHDDTYEHTALPTRIPDLLECGTQLAPVVFRNTNQLQTVQALLMRKLALSATDPVFMPLTKPPIFTAMQHQPSDKVAKSFWYYADNEYELSSPRISEINSEERDQLVSAAGDPNASSQSARDSVLQSIISMFDAAYYSNLFQLYDYLCYRRAVLHDQLIELIATLRQSLLVIDKQQRLHNLIWYATFDEINQSMVPSLATLKQRKHEWQLLQALPLTHPNQLQSWDDLAIVEPHQKQSVIKGEELSRGLVRGRVGHDVRVVSSLTQGALADQRTTAIITERGGMLSHVAILARERGVAVIRVDNATKLLHDGDAVIVDTAKACVSSRINN